MCRYLRCETNARQVPRKGAGIISSLGAGISLGGDTRCCLRCEENTRHVPRRVSVSSTRSGPTAVKVLPPAWPCLPRLRFLR
jgi:hypothetical protein